MLKVLTYPILVVLLALGGAAAASATDLPNFDTDTYCRNVADSVGGSYEIELGCRKDEGRAFDQLQQINIPTKIVRYCTGVANSVGGSYEIFLGCVNDEVSAREKLDN